MKEGHKLLLFFEGRTRRVFTEERPQLSAAFSSLLQAQGRGRWHPKRDPCNSLGTTHRVFLVKKGVFLRGNKAF